METNQNKISNKISNKIQNDLEKLSKPKLIEMIRGYQERLIVMEECRHLLRVDSVRS